jgi:hypothetical protein
VTPQIRKDTVDYGPAFFLLKVFHYELQESDCFIMSHNESVLCLRCYK